MIKSNTMKIGVICGLVALVLSSCVSRQKLAYFQNMERIDGNTTPNYYTTVIENNDLLNITVSPSGATEMDLKLVQPFNLPVTPAPNVTGTITGQPRLQSYLVDNKGNIDFPVLGQLHVAGLTRQALIELLKTRISEYVNNPIINVRIDNFKVSVLGEVKMPGSYQIEDERITLPEALALAGDMTIYGRRDNVLVIRETEGIKKYAYLDLTKSDFIDSPYYYLQQNDVVYIEPNKAQMQASAYNRNIPIFISVASVLISIAILITK
ncbi:polysaccharide biosynthesis/export family protein [Zhouia amylolytica]|nr:polysaccharide biosynthesis/export family protein [Zhouia amylolytica]